ncbi:OmpA family protein [Psychrobacter sp. M13]|uniref:OmpA family protein n=1 Tax=Psychrobacter sp. M13 TaxID=3067275 RepID=UPI00273CF342|nr:OmpA family protein [Psychrobacter sp. M13]WLP93362.1 OmpA family protein [Psychrobacter sp. M13]
MNNQCILKVSKPLNKFSAIVFGCTFLAISPNSQAESCNDAKAIEQYNMAISASDITHKLELLQQATTACSATYEMLLELGDAYFENQQLDYAINIYSRTLNRSISDSQAKQANIFMRLMYAYNSKAERLTVNQYARKIQLLKANGMTWDMASEQSYQALYRKNKQQLTEVPITVEELKIGLNKADEPSNRNLAVIGIDDDTSSSSVQIDMDIKFSSDSSSLTLASKDTLNQIINALNGNSDSIEQIKVIGHTDSKGTNLYNQHLSERRARTVSNYIQEKIPSLYARLISLGMGESELIDTANSESAHALNRRVVFQIE